MFYCILGLVMNEPYECLVLPDGVEDLGGDLESELNRLFEKEYDVFDALEITFMGLCDSNGSPVITSPLYYQVVFTDADALPHSEVDCLMECMEILEEEADTEGVIGYCDDGFNVYPVLTENNFIPVFNSGSEMINIPKGVE